jgi:hypothetical protein
MLQMYVNYMQSARYSCQILTKLEFSRRVLKTTPILNFIKIRPVGVELFHADKQNVTKLTVAFRSSANAPKIKDV